MSSATVGHRFNSDLKLDQHDCRWLDPEGVIRHVLIHKELPHLFEHYDEQAKHAKRHAQISGLWAIGLIWFALILAALELALKDNQSKAVIVAWLAVIGGLVGVVGTLKVLIGGRRQKWFHQLLGLLVILLTYIAIATITLWQLEKIPLPIAAGFVILASVGVAVWFTRDHMTQADRELDAIRGVDLVMAPGKREWFHEFGWLVIFIFPVAVLTMITAWWPEWMTVLMKVIAAYFGVSGVVVGLMGVLIGPRKEKWLHNRFRTERIRQFYFQTFLLRVGQILKGGDEFNSNRQREFHDLRKRLTDEIGIEFDNTVEGKADKTEVWLLEELKNQERQAAADIRPGETERPIETAANQELKFLFRAYRELRIQHQIDYAAHKLREGHRKFFASPIMQAHVLWSISLGSIILICLFHVYAVLIPSANLSAPIIIVAITALAIRAMEQGLQPEREKERYQQYLWALEDVRDRFEMRWPENGPWKVYQARAALRIMEEMERLSYREMRDFLICGNDAQFVM